MSLQGSITVMNNSFLKFTFNVKRNLWWYQTRDMENSLYTEETQE